MTTQTTTDSAFKRLAALDCSAHVEKKGKFSYLSWPWAVKMLRETDPRATWEVRRFEGLPFLSTDAGTFVEVAVTVDGITLSQVHPVLNGANKPIPKPDAFDINTSIQRCLVKAIALHGLGLYIYAGEDLHDAPPAEEGIGTKQLTELLANMDRAATLTDLQTTTKNALQIAKTGLDSDSHGKIKAHGILLAKKFSTNGAQAGTQ